MRQRAVALALLASLAGLPLRAATQHEAAATASPSAARATAVADTLTAGHWAFYNARYLDAAALARAAEGPARDNLAAFELRTSALLFLIKRLVGTPADRRAAVAACEPCPLLLEQFTQSLQHGRAIARARLQTDPVDDEAAYVLGKLDLNYVWLQLGPLGRRTGWREYWEARRTLDALIARRPTHTRALVARAWIDYIVDTKLPRGTRWVLGGGNRKHALRVMRTVWEDESDFFSRAEAAFGLWEMEIREANHAAALSLAQDLSRHFPSNADLATFVATSGKQHPRGRD